MRRSKASVRGGSRPVGDGGSDRRSGQGAGSALQEMLRRQAQNPRPGAIQAQQAERAPGGTSRVRQPPNR